MIEEELGKAKSGSETIATPEATKARNLGALTDITKKAKFGWIFKTCHRILGALLWKDMRRIVFLCF